MITGASRHHLEGGCHCGAVRYRRDAAPFDAGYCHCPADTYPRFDGFCPQTRD